jgi:hypothetical protein
MRGDVRSRRIAVVPDAVLNPPDGGDDRLSALGDAGWGVVGLCPAELVPEARAAWLEAVVDQVVTFLDDGYEVALVDDGDADTLRFTAALAEVGRFVDRVLTP